MKKRIFGYLTITLLIGACATSPMGRKQFMSTHPNPEKRIEKLSNNMAQSLKISQQFNKQGKTPHCQ